MPTAPDGAESPRRTPRAVRLQVAALQFAQYWPLGVWFACVPTYIAANTGDLGSGAFSTWTIGLCFASAGLGGLFSPALFGWVADHHYPAERVMAALHALAALVLVVLWRADDDWTFTAGCLVYFHLFGPTISLSNAIALRRLVRPEQEFASMRAVGTLGWIAAGWFIGGVWPLATGVSIESTATPMLIGTVSGLATAAFCLTLPLTVPQRPAPDYGDAVQRDRLWRNRAFVAFLLVTVVATIPFPAYHLINTFLNDQGYSYAAAKQTLGQLSEVGWMLLLPALVARLGLKRVFLLGVSTWALRFALLAAGAAWSAPAAVIAAVALHGPSYVSVHIAGQLYIDRLVAPSRRAIAQGWHAVATTGCGHLLGAASVAAAQFVYLTPPGVSPPPNRWPEFWLVPAAISVVAGVLAIALLGGGQPQSLRSSSR